MDFVKFSTKIFLKNVSGFSIGRRLYIKRMALKALPCKNFLNHLNREKNFKEKKEDNIFRGFLWRESPLRSFKKTSFNELQDKAF